MTVHHFAIYEAATGKVLRMGRSTNPAIYDVQKLAEGEALYRGEIDPAKIYLPNGEPTPKPVDVENVTPAQIKAHAARLLSYSDWYVTRQQETGADIPESVLTYRQAVRDASGEIEAMDPIPADYRNTKYWPVEP